MDKAAILESALNKTLGDVIGLVTADNNKYRARGGNATAMVCTDPEVMISGPSRTGKTRANLELIHQLMHEYPKSRALIVRKTRASLSETVLQTFEDHVLGAGHYLTEGPQRQFRQTYNYRNGSQIVLGGMDKATRIMSSEYDIIYFPEAIEGTLNDWEALITRLSNGKMPFQQIRGDTNPDKPTHWLKQRCDAGVTKMFFSDHKDNPVLWDEATNDWTPRGRAYISKLDNLTGVRKQRLRYGRWVQAEGAIYDMWDEAIHLIDSFPIPASWRRIRIIDFGFTNPFVCLWIAIDPDGRMYLYREIYHTQRTVRVHAEQIKKLSGDERYEATIADHDAEDRATLQEAGIKTIAAEKAVSVGIQAMQERLKVAGDGRPRLFIMRNALVELDENLVDVETGIKVKPTCTLEEIVGYVWEKTPDGKPNKESPLKVDDHGMDAYRYGVMYLDAKKSSNTAAVAKATGLYGASRR